MLVSGFGSLWLEVSILHGKVWGVPVIISKVLDVHFVC